MPIIGKDSAYNKLQHEKYIFSHLKCSLPLEQVLSSQSIFSFV